MNRRRLLLVRHGEYQISAQPGVDGSLTRRGRRQATHLARHLISEPITRVVCSSLCRARETADVMYRAGNVPKPTVSASLREFLPSSVPGIVHLTPTARLAAAQRLDQVVEKYLRPRAREVLLLVAHGNLIRALVCRAVGMRLHLWYRMSISHCSVTEVAIESDGETLLVRLNEVGFLPLSMRST